MNANRLRIFMILFVLISMLSLFLVRRKLPLIQVQRSWMFQEWKAGEVQVILQGHRSEEELNEIAALGHQEIVRLDSIINEYKGTSEAGRLRLKMEKGEKNIVISEELFHLLSYAQSVSRSSEGAFDITVGPLLQLWKKSGEAKEVPSSREINEAIHGVGWKKLQLDPARREVSFSSPTLSFALGAFSKGYAVDRMVEVYRKQGIEAGMVNMGGDLRCFGNRVWKIGIQDPRIQDAEGAEEIVGIIQVENRAVATSGHYRRYVEIEGKRYSHIVDPRTGFPVPLKTVSVTVIAETTIEADAYATVFCVLSAEDSLRLAQERKLEVALITHESNGYEIHTTPGFGKHWVQKPDFKE